MALLFGDDIHNYINSRFTDRTRVITYKGSETHLQFANFGPSLYDGETFRININYISEHGRFVIRPKARDYDLILRDMEKIETAIVSFKLYYLMIAGICLKYRISMAAL